MSTEHVTNHSPPARALAGTHEQRQPKASAHSLRRMVRLRWERLADGYYKAGRYSAIRIRNRYSFRVDGASMATGLTLNQCKLEAMRREQPKTTKLRHAAINQRYENCN